MRRRLLALASLSFVLSGCVNASPESLSSSLQAALDKGDMDAALALGDFARCQLSRTLRGLKVRTDTARCNEPSLRQRGLITIVAFAAAVDDQEITAGVASRG